MLLEHQRTSRKCIISTTPRRPQSTKEQREEGSGAARGDSGNVRSTEERNGTIVDDQIATVKTKRHEEDSRFGEPAKARPLINALIHGEHHDYLIGGKLEGA